MARNDKLVQAAQYLLKARQSGVRLHGLPPDCQPLSTAEAYAIQDLQLREMSPVAAWKVGAKGATAEPSCAPLSGTSVFKNTDALQLAHLQIEGVEVELGVVLGADLPARNTPYADDEVLHAIARVCVAVEVVDSRYHQFMQIDGLSKLADFSSHGMVVYHQLGTTFQAFDSWEAPFAELRIDDTSVVGPSQNPAVDVKRLLTWLANHTSQRGVGLQHGQLIITGSCFPMAQGAPGQTVIAKVADLAEMHIRLPGAA